MADVPRRRLFGRRSTETPPSSEPVEAPTTAPTAPPAVPAPSAVRSGPRGERTMTVAVRLTPAEHALWLQAATASGRLQLGRWARETVARQLQGRPASVALSAEAGAEVAALRAELSKVGSNLNQVARALNVANRGDEAAPPPAAVLQAIDATRIELSRVRDQLAERSGR